MAVGYIGLGAMGRALASHLAARPDFLVWDLNPAAIDELVAKGATAAESLADMGARCDIVLLCLPKSANVEQALFGKNGLASTLAPGSVVIDQTSGVPAEARAFGARLATHGVHLIDAPVAGGVPSAIAGQITIMASGADEAFVRVRPVLEAISPKVYHCSQQVGDGQALKAINNLVNAAYRISTLEIFAVGRRLGLGAAEITDALNAGAGRSFISYRLLPAVVAQNSSTDFALSLMVKDLNQAAELGIASGTAMPISDTARGFINAVQNLLGDDARLDDIVPFMERMTKTTLAGEAAPDLHNAVLALIVDAIAITNRSIMLENIILALRSGQQVSGFAPVLGNGSASSAQADVLFEALRSGQAQDDESIGDALNIITQLCEQGAELGIPMQMTNQVRAQLLSLSARFEPAQRLSEILLHVK